MRVLVACESSGVVREAFRRRGHDAWSCDLRSADDGSPHHYTMNVLALLDKGWDLLIAHPPCTYLASSGMHWTARGKRDPALTDEAVTFARTLMDAPIPRRAVENPVGVLSTRVRKPDQIIQPWQFGHDASKATCLWLHGLPRLAPTHIIEARIVNGRPRWGNQTDSGQNRLGPSSDRWRIRSQTYRGVADAMAAQWG